MNREEMHCELSKFKRNKHQQHLAQLPKIFNQLMMSISFTLPPTSGRRCGKNSQREAAHLHCRPVSRTGDGGKGILNALYEAKRQRPERMCGCWSTGIVHNVDALALRI